MAELSVLVNESQSHKQGTDTEREVDSLIPLKSAISKEKSQFIFVFSFFHTQTEGGFLKAFKI